MTSFMKKIETRSNPPTAAKDLLKLNMDNPP
jgi:hypothetical protein